MADSKEVQALKAAVNAHARILTTVRVSPERDEEPDNDERRTSAAQ